MSKCKDCPHIIGDTYQRDCCFPDCVGGWEKAYKDLSEELQLYKSAAKLLIEQYEAEDNYKMGGKLTNKPFLQFKRLLENK